MIVFNTTAHTPRAKRLNTSGGIDILKFQCNLMNNSFTKKIYAVVISSSCVGALVHLQRERERVRESERERERERERD